MTEASGGVTKHLGQEGFSWWFGTVRNFVDDDHKVGFAYVAVIGINDPNEKDKKQLLKCQTLLPTTSPSVEGVGDTPQLEDGTAVFGFYVNQSPTEPLGMILGVIPTIPGMKEDKNSISYLARGKQIIEKDKKRYGIEPKSPYAAEYPYNRVIRTRSGHTIELDDTKGKERIHLYHKAGTYIEIDPKGDIVIKTPRNRYDVVEGDNHVDIKGGDFIRVKGNVTCQVDGNVNVAAKGSISLRSKQKIIMESEASISLNAKKGVSVGGMGGLTAEGNIVTKGALTCATGADACFTTATGETVHVHKGIVSNIK